MARRTGRPSYQLDKANVGRRPTARYAAVAGVIALVTALLGGLVGYQVGRPDATEAAIASIKQAEAKRDVQQIAELIETARRVRGPGRPGPGRPQTETAGGRAPDAAKARQWQEVMRQAAAPFADPPSGTTATNVARGGLRGAVRRPRWPSTPTLWPPLFRPRSVRPCWTSPRGRRPRRRRSGRSRRPSSTRSASTPARATSTCSWTQTLTKGPSRRTGRRREPAAEALCGPVSGLPAAVGGGRGAAGRALTAGSSGRRADRVRSRSQSL